MGLFPLNGFHPVSGKFCRFTMTPNGLQELTRQRFEGPKPSQTSIFGSTDDSKSRKDMRDCVGVSRRRPD
jgi:hypothetical protein